MQLEMRRRQCVILEACTGCEIECVIGSLWVAEAGGAASCDHVLAAGGRRRLRAGAPACVTALAFSLVRIRHPRCASWRLQLGPGAITVKLGLPCAPLMERMFGSRLRRARRDGTMGRLVEGAA